MDPSNSLVGIFNQIVSNESQSCRKNVIMFLVENLKRLPGDKISPDLEEFIIEQSNNLLHGAADDQFAQVISLLSSLKSLSTLQGRQKLVNTITNHILQSQPIFNPQILPSVAQLLQFGKLVTPLLSVWD